MDVDAVSAPLRERLGLEATIGLLELLDAHHRERDEDVMVAVTDRFERRLTEEASGLRIQMAQLGAELRQEMAAMRADLREEMATMRADLREEMATMGADLRREMATMGADLRQEMATIGGDLRQEMAAGRVDLFKWCFLFWIGQVLPVGGIVGVMLRVMR